MNRARRWIVKKISPILIVFGLALASVGCTQVGAGLAVADGVSAAAIEQKRQASDIEARMVLRAPCIMTAGAFFRLDSQSDREGVALLCGGRANDAVVR